MQQHKRYPFKNCRFPLNRTYFQINEVFADHDSSINPINIPGNSLCGLVRRTVHFGKTISTTFKGSSVETIEQCFSKGNICLKGFDRTARKSRPLIASLLKMKCH
ncbi:hypothetical protein Bca4012_009138 [Brassica carinata]